MRRHSDPRALDPAQLTALLDIVTLPASTPSAFDPALLPARVLVLAAKSGDHTACADALGFHARRSDALTVVVFARAALAQESATDLAASGITDVRELAFEAGAVGACTDLVLRIQALLADVGPLAVYVPSPDDLDPDRRSVSSAAVVALASGPQRSVVFYSVDARAHAAGGAQAKSPANCVRCESHALLAFQRAAQQSTLDSASPAWPRTTAVVSTWNRRDDVRSNLESLRAQTLPFREIIVVDNASTDGTAEMIAREFPEVRLIAMPHDLYGACATFNIGFASSTTELTAILDDDIVMPPNWLEKATARLLREPATTAILSTQVVEPGTPPEYLNSKLVNEERYMSTFRGCASLARTHALREAHFYDERLFLYGNERDLTCRLLNLGYRVLQYPGCGVFHKTPFGIKMGKRSLYFHARNAWLSMIKYAPLSDLLRMPWLVFSRVILRGDRKEAEGSVRDATGTIGIGRSLRETKGATWVVFKALCSVVWNIPYCLKHRQPVKSADFELPLK